MARKVRFPPATRKFEIPLYGGTVFYYTSPKAFNAALSCINEAPDMDGCQGLFAKATTTDGTAVYLLGVFVKERSVLAHEVAHLTMAVLDRAGMDPRDSGGEAFCYLLGMILEYLGIDKK